MADAALLSDLCTVCHSPPKYRCPRCSARTCSLACSKRHKQWAQCNGTRDPAAYAKRSEIATPAGLDRDYNFIAGIERKLERAERDAEARGVQLHAPRQNERKEGPVKGEVNLQKAIQECRVIVEKAPRGMKRGSQNGTSWNKKQRCISWSVEWILADGRSELGTCLETRAISEAYSQQFDPSPPATKKQKLSKTKDKPRFVGPPPPENSEAPLPSPPPPISPSENPDTAPAEQALQPGPDSHPELPQPPPPAPDTPINPLAPPSTPPPPRHFYLHIPHPRIPTSKPTLSPFSPTATLSTILQTRIVREFPTIYVLEHPAAELPQGKYALERDPAGEMTEAMAGLVDGGEVADELVEEKGKIVDDAEYIRQLLQ